MACDDFLLRYIFGYGDEDKRLDMLKCMLECNECSRELYDGDYDPLYYATIYNHYNIIVYLVERGDCVNKRYYRGPTTKISLLDLIINDKIRQYLITHGADKNLK